MLYFTSDAHFCDEDTIINDNRPFKSPRECDRFLLQTWNKQAGKNDTIYVIGDFVDCDNAESDSWKKSLPYVKKIKAPVVLIIGNNEERVIKYFFNDDFDAFKKYCVDLGFKDVCKDCVVSFNGYSFYLVHKPQQARKEYLNLFGHTHRGGGIYRPFGFNIGCDLNHFYLYSEQDILRFLEMKRKYWDEDKNINLWKIDD